MSAKLPPFFRVSIAPSILGSHLFKRKIEYAGLKKRAEPDKQQGWSEPHSVPSPVLKFCFIISLDKENLPKIDDQIKLVEKIKNDRDSLGSVNLRADIETKKYEDEIKKMENDRYDLY